MAVTLQIFVVTEHALRDNRIELVHASWSELTISINDVTLTDEGMYTCSLFTMPVRTAKAYMTVLGVPQKPEIDGLTKPALEGDHITLTCMTQGSKPAADLRWFRNEKEVKGTAKTYRPISFRGAVENSVFESLRGRHFSALSAQRVLTSEKGHADGLLIP
ncbi:Cell adhesion molecule 2 [Liparis tanakae]|uniref:Cell adhesion molecule 2 n=1 Tax=Liparis tanakae TaxID=230148 RepID=A0A4Z2GDE8_9TELE|nr:Cell adhesion molecule 2 [Liparis tanakae]